MASAEDARDEKIEVMGESLGRLHHELTQELIYLHAKWNEFLELYGESDERVDLLNRVAPWHFFLLQRSFMNEVLVHICRLTDPPRTAGKENLSLHRLPEKLVEGELRNKVDELLERLNDAAEFVRERRNRKIAHLDLLTHREEHLEPLPPARIEPIEEVLKIMREVMNTVREEFIEGAMAYEHFFSPGGSEALIRCLERGVEAEERERRKRRKGEGAG